MEIEEVYSRLRDVFFDIFLDDDIVLTAATTADDVIGWDSYKQIEIILGVEERFGIHFSAKEVDELKNVGELVSLIAAKV